MDSNGSSPTDAERLSALAVIYAADRQAASVSEQTTTIHVATGLALFAGVYSVLFNALSDLAKAQAKNKLDHVPVHSGWWWILLPTLTVFHFGWAAFRASTQAAEEQARLDHEAQLRERLGIEIAVEGEDLTYQFPLTAAVSKEVRHLNRPIGGAIISIVGVTFYFFAEIMVVILSFKLMVGINQILVVMGASLYGIVILVIAYLFGYSTFAARRYFKDLVRKFQDRMKKLERTENLQRRLTDVEDRLKSGSTGATPAEDPSQYEEKLRSIENKIGELTASVQGLLGEP